MAEIGLAENLEAPRMEDDPQSLVPYGRPVTYLYPKLCDLTEADRDDTVVEEWLSRPEFREALIRAAIKQAGVTA